MDIKKIILTILMLFVLNFTVPAGGQIIISREKDKIAFVIRTDDNNNTSDLLEKNSRIILTSFVSLTLQVYLTDLQCVYNNTS